MTVTAVRRFALTLLLVLLAAWLLVIVGACTFQRSLLYFPDARLIAPDPAGPPVQVVRLTTSDGERLVAWFVAPAAGKPVILFFSGNGERLIGETDRLTRIHAAGVGVLAVAYRGYSGSTGHPTEAGLHRDAEAAYAWLAARYPAEDIVIHGHSLGTGVAVRLAADHPARALILESPFTSVVDVAAGEFPWLPVRLLTWDRFASKDWIGKVHMPVLIVHGDADDVVPFRLGRELYRLANQPKSFIDVVGGGHNNLPEMGLYDDIWKFLDLQPVPAPAQPSR